MIRYWLALLITALPATAVAQIGPPTAIQERDGAMHTVIPAATLCSSDGGLTWVPCPTSGSGGGAAGPTRATSITTAASIATAGVFQSVLTANAARLGCYIVNTANVAVQIYLGAPTSASSATALPVPAGGSFSCGNPGGVVLTDQISATSATAGATLVIVAQ